jgi:hypothetical protein
MKRYRVLAYDFDARATVLSQEIKEDWQPHVKELWFQNKTQIKEELLAEYGPWNGFRKIEDFTELGPAPISVNAFHNNFLRQVRSAFVIGAYYPALTGACALGERVLNQLILHLRDDYRGTPEYKRVHNRDSFDDWDLAIDTLESWQVLLPNVVSDFQKLRDTRHRAIHFNPETDQNDRNLALEAIRTLSNIISGQFAGFGPLPWYIPKTMGAAFLKKDAENIPFVKRVVLPNCRLVGYLHTLESKDNTWIVHDDHDYEDREVSDEEFAELFNNRKI